MRLEVLFFDALYFCTTKQEDQNMLIISMKESCRRKEIQIQVGQQSPIHRNTSLSTS
jgi:hypothetical protein